MSHYQSTTAHGNGFSAPVQVIGSTAMDERRDMQGLNDRLAAFLNRLRQLQAQAGQMDTTAYHNAIMGLKDEIAKLKALYEGELDKLRRALHDCNSHKNSLCAKSEKDSMEISDLQNKLKLLLEQNNKLTNEVSCLRNSLAQKDKYLADQNVCLNEKEAELQRLRPLAANCSRDLEDIRKKLELQIALRGEAEDKLRQLCDQRKFDNQAKDKEINDLKNRLDAAGGIIASLEQKIRELANVPGMNLQALLQQLREGNAEQLRKLQRDTEEALNRSLAAMRGQLDEYAKDRDNLKRLRDQLQDELAKYKALVADLQGQLNACSSQNKSLQDALNFEKADARQRIDSLEQRLHDLQEGLMKKTQECNAARDQQVSLKAEIEAYKNLLDAEESRLVKPTGYTTMTASRTSPPNGLSSTAYRTNVGPGLTADNSGSSKYMTARGQPPAGTGTKDEYCSVHGYSKGGTSGPGLHSKGITEYSDRYCDSRSRMLHANPCGAPGFTSKQTRTTSYNYN